MLFDWLENTNEPRLTKHILCSRPYVIYCTRTHRNSDMSNGEWEIHVLGLGKA
jgi:hypothetical protein